MVGGAHPTMAVSRLKRRVARGDVLGLTDAGNQTEEAGWAGMR